MGRKTTIGLVAALGMLATWGSCHRGTNNPTSTPPPILRPADRVAVAYDSRSHTVSIATPTGVKRQYARNPIVRVEKDGTIKIDRKTFGLERRPFLGVGYGDAVRLHVGLSLAYAWRLDLNAQVAFSFQKNDSFARLLLSGSYNAYSNTSVFAGVDPFALAAGRPSAHAGVMVHF